ncbi:O-antigen ligase family protein [Avibacterium sp. 20-15]|uniref:O-antigen ligase family protein n=1 Tax=unclassified Avibacterium TaxID=2685287 RepID=UPI002026A491|nr:MULTISPECIES: O-antigen ligase family protein [unclassified Avibacterium]MCW9732194.1 O-antigen ligase family protein [Avibacterium sp. 20-15]URL05547.1 O-antigen ligase family protein [Avibacterium sp. 20-132]
MRKSFFLYSINVLILIFFVVLLSIKSSYYVSPVILVALSFFYIFSNYKNIEYRYDVKKYVIFSLLYYIVGLFVAILNGDAIPSSFKADHFLLLSIPILFLLIRYRLNFKFLAIVFGVSCLIYGIQSLYNKFYLGLDRAFDLDVINPIPAAAIIMTVTLYCIALGLHYLEEKDIKMGAFLLFSSCIGLLGNIVTGTRGSWIAFPFILFFLFFKYRISLKKIVYSFFIFLISIIIVVSIIPQFGVSKRYQAALDNITQYVDDSNAYSSVGVRFDLYKGAWYAIQEKPILGWGRDGMLNKRHEQAESGVIPNYTKDYTHSHNQFIEQTYHRGIVGLFVLLLLIYTFLKYFINIYKSSSVEDRKIIGLLGIINILGLISFNLTDALLINKEYAMFFYMCNVVFYAMTINNNRRVPE